MEIVIWIFQVFLAALFLKAALKKLTLSKGKLAANNQPEAMLLPFQLLGVLELLGVAGIILPQLLHVYPVLTPVTAVCFCIVLIGAFAMHLRQKGFKMLPMIVISFMISVMVAYYRF